MQSPILVCSIGIAALTLSPSIRAREPANENPVIASEANHDATDAFWKGKQAYEAGEYALAEEQFAKAFALTRDPELLFDIAQAQRKGEKCEQAIRSYLEFLRGTPTSPLAPRAQRQISDLQSTCISLETQGSEPDTNHLHTRTMAEQAPIAAPAPLAAPVPPALAPTLPKESGAMRAWSVATFASSLVVAGIATGMELWNHSRYDEWRTRDAELAKGTGTTSREVNLLWAARQQSNDKLGQSISRVDNETLILGLGAGALLTTSAILFYSSATGESRKTSALIERAHVPVLAIGPRHVGLAVSW